MISGWKGFNCSFEVRSTWFSRYKQGFSDFVVNFSAEAGGARYTDHSEVAHKHHVETPFGTVGHQVWEGLR